MSRKRLRHSRRRRARLPRLQPWFSATTRRSRWSPSPPTQIPGIAGRRYPPELAGPLYPEGIPIVDEAELEALCRHYAVARVVFAYSDVPHAQVMHLASRALAAGADFELLGPAAPRSSPACR